MRHSEFIIQLLPAEDQETEHYERAQEQGRRAVDPVGEDEQQESKKEALPEDPPVGPGLEPEQAPQTEGQPDAVAVHEKLEAVVRRGESQKQRRPQRGHERIRDISKDVAREQKKGGQARKDVESALNQEIGQRVGKWPGQERNQHADAVQLPVEGGPAVQADRDMDQGIGMLALMERSEVDDES